MVTIDLNGEIGWEIWPTAVRSQLKMSAGDDLTVRFSSIGGDIFEGADIFNMLSDHKRDNPGIKMNLELKGVAASMGSAIASSPAWDEVAVESITGYMIHRPSSFAFGDFNDMRSRADFLEKATDLYAGVYSNRSGMAIDEIQTLMEAETWYFGQDIVDAGFADRVIESDQSGDPAMLLVQMKNKFADMSKNQKKLHEDESFDVVRAAAVLREQPPKANSTMTIETPGKPDEIKPAPVGNLKTEVPMNEAELKKDNPELYEAIMKKGADTERDQNDERVKALNLMKANEDYKDMPEVIEAIDKCIADGTSAEGANPIVMAAMMKIMKNPARMAALESPGDIGSGDQEDPASETQTEKIGEV